MGRKEDQYLYALIEVRCNQPIRYFSWFDGKFHDSMRDGSLFRRLELAMMWAQLMEEKIPKNKKQKISYQVVSIKRNAMPYCKWEIVHI